MALTHEEMIDRVYSSYKNSKENLAREKKAWKKAKKKIVTVRKGQKYVQEMAQQVQQYVHDQIAGLVSMCLEGVFPDPYTFKIVFEQKRGRTEARPVFLRKGHEVNPMTAASGGVKQVAALAARLGCIKLSLPPKRKLISMDEPFNGVWEGYQHLITELLTRLSKELKFQFVYVTQNQNFRIGKVVEF